MEEIQKISGEFTKDEDVEIYMKSDICVKFNNVHEYHK